MIWTALGLVLVFFVAWGWFSSGLLLKMERFPVQYHPGTFGVPYEDVVFETEDGVRITGWFCPAPAPSETTLVLCHGWGANRADLLERRAFLQKRGGYNLLFFDFRNHGESGAGLSSLISLEARDLEAALRFLKERKPEQSRRLGLYGLSMGGAVALRVAADHTEIEGVVAESPFSSFDGVVVRFARLFYHTPRYPLMPVTLFFMKARLGLDPEKDAPVRHVARIAPRPLLLIQGGNDERMPPSEGELLFKTAEGPKELWTVPGADHAEAAEVAGAEYEEKLLAFYGKVFRR